MTNLLADHLFVDDAKETDDQVTKYAATEKVVKPYPGQVLMIEHN